MARHFVARVDRFTGLDCLSPREADRLPGASPDMLNFSVTADGKLEKRRGYEYMFASTAALRGIWCGRLGDRDLYVAVFGGRLFVSGISFREMLPVPGAVPGADPVEIFPFWGKLYLLTGSGIFCTEGDSLAPIEPYEPLLTTATAPSGEGVVVDEINALTPKVYQKYVPDGTSTHYHLAVRNVASIDRICRGGADVSDDAWYWDTASRTVTFLNAPLAGGDDLEIHYSVTQDDPDLAGRVLRCRHAVTFGGANDTRVFLYGCDDAPAMRYHSGMAAGVPCMGYFPALGYTQVGDGSPITGMLRHYDRQLIFTEKAAYYSTLEYVTEPDGRRRAIFPVLPLADGRGNEAVAQPLLMENEPVTWDRNGLFRWVSTNVRDERNAQCFSFAVNAHLAGWDLSRAVLFNRRSTGELFAVCGTDVLVYRYGTGSFYPYKISGSPIRFMREWEGETYFGTGDAVCRVTGWRDGSSEVEACWHSSFTAVDAPDLEKNLYSGEICVDTGEGGAECRVSVKGIDGALAAEGRWIIPATGGVKRRRMPLRYDHFERMQVKLTSSGNVPVRVSFLTLRGKVTDKIV
ncbi:MAG: hypothetical protein II776_06890 [Clostridia bacterium]|nr:hypothetical protein [Clostridia bacterium]